MDYLFPFLRLETGDTYIRISHSILGCLLFPMLTILLCLIPYSRKYNLKRSATRSLSIQVIFAGLSHIFLDMLVAVFPHVLFFPLSWEVYRLPFGLLPSAAHISLDNPYFYRNTGIELVIFMPILGLVFLRWFNVSRRVWRILTMIALISITLSGMVIAFQLER